MTEENKEPVQKRALHPNQEDEIKHLSDYVALGKPIRNILNPLLPAGMTFADYRNLHQSGRDWLTSRYVEQVQIAEQMIEEKKRQMAQQPIPQAPAQPGTTKQIGT